LVELRYFGGTAAATMPNAMRIPNHTSENMRKKTRQQVLLIQAPQSPQMATAMMRAHATRSKTIAATPDHSTSENISLK
jgi:hypothetical protein